MTYNPLTGENWDLAAARNAWAGSMDRSLAEGPKWMPRGSSGAWWWEYFNFQPYRGRVTLRPEGFYWATYSYDTGELIHSGVTTSLYEAYQSVVQNTPVTRQAEN